MNSHPGQAQNPATTFDVARVGRYFNRIAATYEQHDWLQREVATRTLERLDGIRLQPKQILDLGAGYGRDARALAKRYRGATVVQLDLAHSMLLQSRRRGPRWRSPHRYVCGDLTRLPLADASVDLVYSCFALQWCSAHTDAIREMRRVLRPGGLLVIAMPGPDTLTQLREAFATFSPHTHVSPFPDMHDLGDLFTGSGFADPVMECERLTIEYNDVDRLLSELRQGGSVNATVNRPRALRGRGYLASLNAACDAFRHNGKLPVSVELIIGHAWAVERQQQTEAPILPLAKLRRR